MSITGKISQDPAAANLDDAVIPIVQDGTNRKAATSLFDARFQAADADLSAIAALAKDDGNIIVGDGTTWVAESGETARNSLGAQEASANLTALAAITPGAAGLAILATETSGDVRDYIDLPVMPEAMASWDGGATAAATADAIEEAIAIAVSANRKVILSSGKTYTYDQITIPNGVTITAAGAIWRDDNSLSGETAPLIIGDDFTIDELNIRTAGGEPAFSNLVQHGARFTAGVVALNADTQRGGQVAVSSLGQECRIGVLRSDNIDRVIVWDNTGGASPTTGSFILSMEIKKYVRAFCAIECDDWYVNDYDLRERSVNGLYTAGHNGFLIGDCFGFRIGDGRVANSGEHAIRLAGALRGCSNVQIGHVLIEKTGGCALKINTTNAARAENIEVAGVHGIDIGEMDGGGGDNKELIRCSHYKNVRVGYAIADTLDHAESAQWCVRLNDGTDFILGHLGGNAVNAGISLDKDSDVDGIDRFSGDVTGVYVFDYAANVNGSFGNAVNIAMSGFSIGQIFINFSGITGFNTSLVGFSGGAPTITGPVVFSGEVYGSVSPSIGAAPADANVRVALSWNGRFFAGQASLIDFASNAVVQQAIQSAFSLADQKATGYLLNSSKIATGSGSYGAGIEFTRLGGLRRGAALALKQTGANSQNTGLAVMVGAGTTATDALLEAAVFTHNTDLLFSAISRGPIIKSPDGASWRIQVDNAGVLSAVAA